MPTLTELISERRAAIEAFDHDVYGPEQHDIIALNHAIERTPIASKADALSALDLIMAETCSEFGAPAPPCCFTNCRTSALR